MCGYFYIGFIDFMLKGKILLDYTNLFSRNDYETGPPLFCIAKIKKGKKGKKGTIFKIETIERLPPRSKCYCFSHSRMSRIQKFFLSVNHGGRQYFPVFHDPPPSPH